MHACMHAYIHTYIHTYIHNVYIYIYIITVTVHSTFTRYNVNMYRHDSRLYISTQRPTEILFNSTKSGKKINKKGEWGIAHGPHGAINPVQSPKETAIQPRTKSERQI